MLDYLLLPNLKQTFRQFLWQREDAIRMPLYKIDARRARLFAKEGRKVRI
jgi:hypothetical protein